MQRTCQQLRDIDLITAPKGGLCMCVELRRKGTVCDTAESLAFLASAVT